MQKNTNHYNFTKVFLHYLFFISLFLVFASPLKGGTLAPLVSLVTIIFYWNREAILSRLHWVFLICWVVSLVLSILLSVDSANSAKGTYDIIRGFLFIFPALIIKKSSLSDTLKPAVTTVLSIGILFSALTLYFDFTNSTHLLVRYTPLVSQIFGNPNDYATGIAIVLIAIFCLILFEDNLRRTQYYLLWLTFVMLLYAELALISRGTILALFFTMTVLIFIKSSWRIFFCFLSSLLLFVLLWVKFGDTASERYIDIITKYGGNITSHRDVIWKKTLQAWLNSPWFGHGINTFKNSGVYPGLTKPHNIYIEALYSFGLIGLIPILLSAYLLIKKAIRNWEINFYNTFGLGLAIYVGIKGSFDMKLASVYFGAYLATIIAFLASSPTHADKLTLQNQQKTFSEENVK